MTTEPSTRPDWQAEYLDKFGCVDGIPTSYVMFFWLDRTTMRNISFLDDTFVRGEVWNRGSGRWEVHRLPRACVPACKDGSRWHRVRTPRQRRRLAGA
jgi:hypothetical protein